MLQLFTKQTQHNATLQEKKEGGRRNEKPPSFFKRVYEPVDLQKINEGDHFYYTTYYTPLIAV